VVTNFSSAFLEVSQLDVDNLEFNSQVIIEQYYVADGSNKVTNFSVLELDCTEKTALVIMKGLSYILIAT
jgi:hypothetical protein